MVKFKYIDRDGATISQAAWVKLRKDKAYINVAEYDNGTVYARIKWIGAVENPDQLYRDHYPLYQIEVSNYGSDGILRSDPNLNDKTYPDEQSAKKAFEEFLVKWTESFHDDDGKFIDDDNTLKPPPPPSKDAPATEIANIKLGAGDDGMVW